MEVARGLERGLEGDAMRAGAESGRADSIYRPVRCRLESTNDLTRLEKQFRLVRLDGEPFGHRPGQFVQVSIFGAGEAPISVASSPTRGPFLELGVRRMGTLTGALHGLGPGDEIGVRGPFGRSFDTEALRGKDMLLMAGGCGLAPMRALIQYCEDRREEFWKACLSVWGQDARGRPLQGRSRPVGRIRGHDLPLHGGPGAGGRGLGWPGRADHQAHSAAADRARQNHRRNRRPAGHVPVGDPELHAKGLGDTSIMVSLERHMKCGVGKCGHCTIEHLYCCLDGPVFWLSEIAGLKGAL